MAACQAGDNVQGWILDHVVGSGSFATVWRAHKQEGTERSLAAVKVISTDRLSPKLKQSLDCEVSILSRISHSNIVKLHEVEKVRGSMYLVMEFCGGGDMAAYIRQHGRISDMVARSFIQQLGAGLKALWQNNFVHRDLKPQNLLLSDNSSQPILKIADFGFARDLQPQGMADTLCGSPLYMAPEILQFQKYDAKADLWSVGVILYELVIGYPPFDGLNHVQLLRNIERHEVCIPSKNLANLTPHCTSLIYQLLRRNPVERISFEEFFSHPFVRLGELPISLPSPWAETSSPSPTRPPPRRTLLPTIASNMAMDLSSSGEEQLPFAMERRKESSWPDGGGLHRVESEPPTFVSKQVAVKRPQQRKQPAIFVGLQGSSKVKRNAVAQMSLTNSIEDEEDYVIIERSHSSGVLRGYSQSAPTSSISKAQMMIRPVQVPPPPPPLTVPLIVTSSPDHRSASMTSSAGVLKFTSELPLWKSLKRIGLLLDEISAQQQVQGLYAESLGLRLLALQVLQFALSRQKAANSSCSSSCPTDLDIPQHMKSIADCAQQVAVLLQSSGEAGTLPDVYEVIYRSALAFAKAAAVDEMLGNFPAALRSYAKAGSLFYFLFAEASEVATQPALRLDAADVLRLHRYTAFIALRHQGCTGMLSSIDGKKTNRKFPSRTVLADRY